MWHGDASLAPIATLPRPIRELHAVRGGRALALADTAIYALDVPGRRVIATIPIAGQTAVADAAGLVAVRTSSGVLEVVDAFAGPTDGVRWTLASATDVVFRRAADHARWPSRPREHRRAASSSGRSIFRRPPRQPRRGSRRWAGT